VNGLIYSLCWHAEHHPPTIVGRAEVNSSLDRQALRLYVANVLGAPYRPVRSHQRKTLEAGRPGCQDIREVC